MTGKLLYHAASDASPGVNWAAALLRGGMIVFFVFMAMKNLGGDEKMAADFARWGYPDWFRQLTAVLQFLGALLLLSPAISFYGALLLSGILLGAIATHVLHDPPAAALSPALFALFAAALCVFYRPEILR